MRYPRLGGEHRDMNTAHTPRSATDAARQCRINSTWNGDHTVVIDIPDVLHWTVRLRHTPASLALSWLGERLPERVWTDPRALGVIGATAGLC